MGNSRSRVSPIRPLRVIDSQTHVRLRNQHELFQLRVKLRNIQAKHNEELSRLAFQQRNAKMVLYQLQHESGQRQLFKKSM
jgi:hypothetical protein